MSAAKTCMQCAAPLPDDAPDSMLCPVCASSAARRTVIDSTPVEPALASDALATIGDYDILEKLGAGGMGAVYKARQITLDRLVALKVLPSQFADDPEYIGRFQREAKVASGLHHDNLVGVYNYGATDGCHYIAMELVEGENLHQLLRHRRVDMAEALGITAYVAQGLKCGWETAQLVHRDIKPSNIYLSYDGKVKVGDLGLAKSLSSNTTGITQTGTMMGTPHYMSPEQCRGDKEIDFRADIYSLGCMLFEMLTGHPPYPGNDPIAIARKHLDSPPPGLLKAMPGCPVPLALLVGRMLKKQPRDRHANYDELIAEIEALYEHIERGEQLDITQFRRPVQRTVPATTVSEGMPEWVWWAGVGLVAVALAIYFMPKPKPKPVVIAATPTAAPATPRTTPIAAATPVGQAPRLPAGTPAPPASGALALQSPPAFGPWQPLFTDAEWKEPKFGKVEVDGRVTFSGATNMLKSLPAADGAVRARVQFTGGNEVGIIARMTNDGGRYKATLARSGESVALGHYPPNQLGPDAAFVQRTLPKPIKPGDTVLFEARLQGDRISVLVDGAVVIEAQDSHSPGPGLWGIYGNNTTFESVEVQTPLPAGPAIVATKDAPFVNTLGMKFLPVPIVGPSTGSGRVLFSVWQTRVRDYAACAAANPQADGSWKTKSRDSVPAGREPDHPVVGVNWEDAQAFCQWLTAKETAEGKLPPGAKYRLPSDEEWSWAVGLPPEPGAAPKEKRESGKNSADFPWGKDWPPTKKVGNYGDETFHGKFPRTDDGKREDQPWIQGYDDGYATTSPVGTFPANAYGLYDLGSNVHEWCEDWFSTDQKGRVLRGASWIHSQREVMLSSHRYGFGLGSRSIHIGFRCVLETGRPASAAVEPVKPALPKDADGWEDLFAKLTPELVAQTGQGWNLKDGELFSPTTKWATLPLPGKVSGTSYTVRVKLRQLAEKNVFHIVLPVADRMCGFDLEGRPPDRICTGLFLVNGKGIKDAPGVVEGKVVNDTEPHDLEVTVRLDGANATITTTLDTRPLYEWTGPTAALSQMQHWATTAPGVLAFGTYAGGWTVSEVKVKRLGL